VTGKVEAVAGRIRLALAGVVVAGLIVPALPAIADPVAAPPDPTGELADPTGELADPTATERLVADLEAAAPSVAVASPGEAVADRLLVTFRDGTPLRDVERVLAAAEAPTDVVDGFAVQVVEVEPGSASTVARALANAPEVLTVEADHVLEVRVAADPLTDEQWWWRNVGQEVRPATGPARQGRADIDIGAERAWRAHKGRSGVVVAVVDTGLDIRHPDLAPNLWENPSRGSFPGCTNDRHGCNFTWQGSSGQVYADPISDRHGTHVAGIIAAAENGIGTVGVAPRVSLMSVKFLVEKQGRVSDGVRAMQYAVASGADVINASWGVSGRVTDSMLRACDQRTATGDCTLAALERTIRDARIPVVTASGNGGYQDLTTRRCVRSEPDYPGSSTAPNVITVTAVDNRGDVPCFANVSTSMVDVAAPGDRVLSTTPERSYDWLDGTSQATPMVTGAVALAISATRQHDGATIAEAVRVSARPFGNLGDGNRPGGTTRAGLASAPGLLHALGAEGLGSCPGRTPRAPFRDLDRADVHTPSIDCLVRHGLAGGFPDGRFRPAQTVTRGQVATFLAGVVRTAQDLPVPARGRFRDLQGDVHRDNIEALAAIGIVDGYRDGTYQAGNRVTREQFASLLVRTYEHLVSGRVRPPSGAGFPDVGGVHERNVNVGDHLGFIRGRTDGRFAPREGVTRAQLGSLLRRAVDKLVDDRVSDLT
jgi:subtilisin family serine protease